VLAGCVLAGCVLAGCGLAGCGLAGGGHVAPWPDGRARRLTVTGSGAVTGPVAGAVVAPSSGAGVEGTGVATVVAGVDGLEGAAGVDDMGVATVVVEVKPVRRVAANSGEDVPAAGGTVGAGWDGAGTLRATVTGSDTPAAATCELLAVEVHCATRRGPTTDVTRAAALVGEGGAATRPMPLPRATVASGAKSGPALANSAAESDADGGDPATGCPPETQEGTGTTWRAEAATTSEGCRGPRSATSVVTKVTAHHATAVAVVVTTIHDSTSTAWRFPRAVMAGE
jgi:hypothetical protein